MVFADDLLVFTRWDATMIDKVPELLIVFGECLGPKVNRAKFYVYFRDVDEIQ